MFQIREAAESDITQLAEFEAEIAAISFGDEAVTDPAQHVKKLRRSFEKGEDITLVLADGAHVLGWLWIAVNTNMFTQDRYANFRSFALAPEVRGSEWGETLFKAGLKEVRDEGVSRIVGKVHVENLPMRLLYKQLGFKPQHVTMELKI